MHCLWCIAITTAFAVCVVLIPLLSSHSLATTIHMNVAVFQANGVATNSRWGRFSPWVIFYRSVDFALFWGQESCFQNAFPFLNRWQVLILRQDHHNIAYNLQLIVAQFRWIKDGIEYMKIVRLGKVKEKLAKRWNSVKKNQELHNLTKILRKLHIYVLKFLTRKAKSAIYYWFFHWCRSSILSLGSLYLEPYPIWPDRQSARPGLQQHN